jgi:adenylosuccinate synthase
MRKLEQLPKQARSYLERIERLSGVAVAALSVGADRGQVIAVSPPFSS